ncbi:COQ9-domain-containing protein [Pilobolus umbonatus]|nr:COQ9-domain-containing protein [Pilobolus umbonatus]
MEFRPEMERRSPIARKGWTGPSSSPTTLLSSIPLFLLLFISLSSRMLRRAFTTVCDPRYQLLEATLPFIPQYGWTMKSMMEGSRSLGYPSVAHGVFKGEAGLIDSYLSYSRQQFIGTLPTIDMEGLSAEDKVKRLISHRLKMNQPYIRQWPQALAIMARPSNVPMSLEHLGNIADDIWYYAGDRSADMNWYTKRASLAAIYSATDLFMTQDMSPHFIESERFLENKLKQASLLDSSTRQLGMMLSFGAKSMASMIMNVSCASSL